MSNNKFSCGTFFLIYNVLPLSQELRLSEGASGVLGVALATNPSELSVPFFFLYIIVSHEVSA
jgi:hypothetical protein